jgi:predicted aspartyl protease
VNTGIVTAFREAVVTIRLVAADGSIHELEAVVDTGFIEFLTLDPTTVERLGFPYVDRAFMLLAGDQQQPFDIHAGTIEWDGTVRAIPVTVADGIPLVGMSLLYGQTLVLPVMDGAVFTIAPFARP